MLARSALRRHRNVRVTGLATRARVEGRPSAPQVVTSLGCERSAGFWVSGVAMQTEVLRSPPGQFVDQLIRRRRRLRWGSPCIANASRQSMCRETYRSWPPGARRASSCRPRGGRLAIAEPSLRRRTTLRQPRAKVRGSDAGHAHLTTTQRCAHVARVDLRAATERLAVGSW
jgi:hypothetical protein